MAEVALVVVQQEAELQLVEVLVALIQMQHQEQLTPEAVEVDQD